MIYGFISSLDDETTKVFFRSKKIWGNSIYNAGSLGELTSVLQSGDVVYTVSCNRFASVRQVYTFARFCHERGIILHFVAEPYLDIGNGKQWRPAIAKVIASMVESEQKAAEAIALATLNMLDKLPDACPNDAYWSLGQLVHRRDNIMKQRTRLVNQLHEQLCIAYPSYKQFFNDISRPTALYFWEHYPSRKYLKGKTVEDLREKLVPVSHNKCSTKTCEKILDAVASDKVKNNDFQDARDMVTLSIVSDLQHYDKQLAEVFPCDSDGAGIL